MNIDQMRLIGGDVDELSVPSKGQLPEDVKNAIAMNGDMLQHRTDNDWVSLPVSSAMFVFRHINHETEGWADIVVGQLENAHSIRYEEDYRAAVQEIGLEAYYTAVESWRNNDQDWGPDEVPELDIGGLSWGTDSASYVLIKKPRDLDQMPVFLQRTHDEEYGKYGGGTWVRRQATNNPYVTIGDTLQHCLGNANNPGSARVELRAGDWILGADPATNNR
tara:strand:+ start:3861 stop:4520 length:660 start_codon:yes stop_codon:yes gene_type:complete